MPEIPGREFLPKEEKREEEKQSVEEQNFVEKVYGKEYKYGDIANDILNKILSPEPNLSEKEKEILRMAIKSKIGSMLNKAHYTIQEMIRINCNGWRKDEKEGIHGITFVKDPLPEVKDMNITSAFSEAVQKFDSALEKELGFNKEARDQLVKECEEYANSSKFKEEWQKKHPGGEEYDPEAVADQAWRDVTDEADELANLLPESVADYKELDVETYRKKSKKDKIQKDEIKKE